MTCKGNQRKRHLEENKQGQKKVLLCGSTWINYKQTKNISDSKTSVITQEVKKCLWIFVFFAKTDCNCFYTLGCFGHTIFEGECFPNKARKIPENA